MAKGGLQRSLRIKVGLPHDFRLAADGSMHRQTIRSFRVRRGR